MVTPIRLDNFADIAPTGSSIPLGDAEGGQVLLGAALIAWMTRSLHGPRNIDANTDSSDATAAAVADRVANRMRSGVSGLEYVDLAWDIDADMGGVSCRNEVCSGGSRGDSSGWVLGCCDNGYQMWTCALEIRGNREVR